MKILVTFFFLRCFTQVEVPAFSAGEPVNRKYNSHFNKSFIYGMETPHYEDGRNTAKTLNWVLDLDS